MTYILSKPLRSTLQKCVQCMERLVYTAAYYLIARSHHYNQYIKENVKVHTLECNKPKQIHFMYQCEVN